MPWAIFHYPNAAPVLARLGQRRRWRKLIHELFSRYRPERHYMRGPGPKWREKHDASSERRGATSMIG